ncbi:sodium/potassium-transporting ATPase subunit beta [Lepeophtheirus salmonis]|uniref:Sodium/potassiumtransporting ATPase subunit beta2like [Bombyx mori] n=1 Tax=Lepeophtheirus salmonis TaxID=72036 RepID=A0A0K2TUR8_LEPSM|nr:sodium/potassium-transporting ATPase subunit beta-like [Lepeophtheirus salmonis]
MEEKLQFAEEDRLSVSYKNSFKTYLYNPYNRDILGRSLLSWAKVLLYSFLFSIFTTFIFTISLWTFYQTLDSHTPKLQLNSSFIGSNPGLGFRPLLKDTNPYSSLIHFIHGGSGTWGDLTENLIDFLKQYDPGHWANAGTSQTKCHWTSGPRSKQDACEFNKEWLSNIGADIKCIEEENFGFSFGKPCILIKLNKIYGWNPEPFYNFTEVEEHPTMPKLLKMHIMDTWRTECAGKGEEIENKCPELNMVWLHCDGETAADKEHIGPLTYTPYRGFPAYYFPFYNQIGYLQPVVMVQLLAPSPGVIMNIECTPWAKGMVHDRVTKRGMVHFEFLMD